MVMAMLVVFTSNKGGVGKSTLSVHLAVHLHDAGAKVALIDADQQGSSSQWLQEAEPGIETATAVNPDEVAARVSSLRGAFDYIVADAPGGNDRHVRTLMLLADLAVFPITPSILDLRSVAAAVAVLKYARTINGGLPEATLLMNRVRKRERIARELTEVAPTIGLSVCNIFVRDLQAFRNAAQQGTVVTRMGCQARMAACDIRGVFSEILSAREVAANE